MSEFSGDLNEAKQCELLMASCAMASQLRKDGEIPAQLLEEQLGINRELRRLYDATRTPLDKPFDKQFTPILGWSSYFKSQNEN